MKNLSYKALFYIACAIAAIEGFYIYMRNDPGNYVLLPSYSFYDSKDTDSDGLVSASGSWISSQTDLAFPVSTVNIECWKEFGHCWLSDATFDDGLLTSGLKLEEINYWNDDFIETKPSRPLLGCVEQVYRLDRRSKTVTYARRTIDTTSAGCEGFQEKPITSSLGDGWKRLDTYRKNR